jgi:hypothetical protein
VRAPGAVVAGPVAGRERFLTPYRGAIVTERSSGRPGSSPPGAPDPADKRIDLTHGHLVEAFTPGFGQICWSQRGGGAMVRT